MLHSFLATCCKDEAANAISTGNVFDLLWFRKDEMSTTGNIEGQAPGAGSQPDKARKLKYWGLGLIGLGMAIQFASVLEPSLLKAQWIGLGVGAIGLAFYAKSMGRSLAWCGVAILPFVGPLLGLLILAVKKRPQAETPKSAAMSLIQLKWGTLLYAGALWLVPLPLGGLSCLALRDDQFPSLGMVEGTGCRFVAFPTLLLACVLGIVFFYECGKAIKTFGVRASARWLALRAVVIGLTLTYFYAFSTFGTASQAAQIVEARTTKMLSELQPAMTQDDVERTILKPMPRSFRHLPVEMRSEEAPRKPNTKKSVMRWAMQRKGSRSISKTCIFIVRCST